MATLRETIQAQIKASQEQVDSLTAQLNTQDKNVQALLLQDMATLTLFYALFKNELTPP